VSPKPLAVYGGSFDPPHVGHVLVCAYVLAAHEVERVLIVPTRSHPFDKPLAPFEQRLRMCELAFADLRRVELSDIERELPQPSLTLRTLQALQARTPGVPLRLVIGSDLLRETSSWHAFEEVEKLAPPLVVGRAGFPSPDGSPLLPEVSSTEVRRRLRAGLATDGLLGPAVAAYARAHDLYRS
jgi:nicotinate-nucleotide adenylyltransferase